MNTSGSKPNIWRVPTTIDSSPLSKGQSSTSPLGFAKPLPTWSSAPPDLGLSSDGLASKPQELTRFPFHLADPYNLGMMSTTNAVARFLLAQVGAAALSSFGPTTATFVDTATTFTATTAPAIEQRCDRNLFSIANHIGDVKEREGEGNAHNGNNSASLCCPICHKDLRSNDLAAHISLELEALDEDTRRWHNCRSEQSIYERCMILTNSGLFDLISSNQRYYKFQLIKQRRLARRMNFSFNKLREDPSPSNQHSLKMSPPLESGFPFFTPTSMSTVPTKIRRIEK
ncbi:hypothetical protein ECG_05418 [Echinococcus granulosus]|uniref:E3 ubiquitin-protein ligase n=1 Tax=Echinococcus granulosus TaxID=6210 RepID=A0A068WKZ0_ECHGR|nr:hypothetical protein ECG_05418 [Echinococcus granulosus]CDS18329.1 hypothetical protein EgrG_000609500 [Echinococcus granulosus]